MWFQGGADRGDFAPVTDPAKFVEDARPNQSNPVAVHRRATNMLYEGLNEKGSIVVVPSSGVEWMNLGALGGLANLNGGRAASRHVGDNETSPAEALKAKGRCSNQLVIQTSRRASGVGWGKSPRLRQAATSILRSINSESPNSCVR